MINKHIWETLVSFIIVKIKFGNWEDLTGTIISSEKEPYPADVAAAILTLKIEEKK